LVEVSFGEWLKRQRSGRGLTQEQLAEKIGCAAITLRKIEGEERRPSAQIVERLADIFSIPQSEQASFLRFARGDWKSAPSIENEDAPWRSSRASLRTKLPASLTSLIGREQELAQLSEYLSNLNIRLVTLIGPPGIGKTRLSIEAARAKLSDFPDGVFFVALAPLEDPNLVAPTVIQALGFVETEIKPPVERLKEGIGEKQMLLVLDNVEHVIEGVAPIVSELLVSCPHLKILTTSREALHIQGEWLYPLSTLVVPEESVPINMEIASQFSALTLFVERARAVKPDFALNTDNLKAVADICTQLDGLPLAIELIAARIRLMPPQVLLQRLSGQFTLYADGIRAASARQKTLHGAIAWSYNLLSSEEQKLFAYLSVFSGGFTLDAAKAIFSRIITDNSVSNLIISLLDKSLLQRTFDHESHDEPRFSMLVTIQQFARDRLRQMDEEVKVRDWHLNYFLDLAQQADKQIHGPEQMEWLNRLEIEHDNYRATLDGCIFSGQTETALQLIGKLSWLWLVRSHFTEALEWFDKLRVSLDVTYYPTAYAMALNGMSSIAYAHGDYLTARAMAENSLSIFQSEEVEDEIGLAGAWFALVMPVAWGGGDIVRAEACSKQAVTIYQARGDHWGEAMGLFRLGVMARWRKDYGRSQLLLEDSLAIFHDLGDIFGQGRVYVDLARLFVDLGDYNQARKMFEQSLIQHRQLRDQSGVLVSLVELGILYRVQGDYDQAEVFIEEALSVGREFNLGDEFIPQFYLGCVRLHRGDYEAAETRFVESIKVAQRLSLQLWGAQISVGDGLVGLAAVAAGLNQYERAAKLDGAGQAIFDTVAFKVPPNDRIEIEPFLQIAREQLGESLFEAFAADGRAMTMEQAIAYALEKTNESPSDK
jgi:predicted ATPase/DNA-binding XRE family transcriptional regulator